MKMIERNISVAELQEMSKKMFGGLVKAVVDIEKGIMVVDAPMHSDQEEFLLDSNSEQANLWGINLFPDKYGEEGFLVFDSMINLRPSWGNYSRSVDSAQTRAQITAIVDRLVVK